MCAKVAQNHETKEQKAKNPSKFCYLTYSVYFYGKTVANLQD